MLLKSLPSGVEVSVGLPSANSMRPPALPISGRQSGSASPPRSLHCHLPGLQVIWTGTISLANSIMRFSVPVCPCLSLFCPDFVSTRVRWITQFSKFAKSKIVVSLEKALFYRLGRLAQLVRALSSHGRSRQFESGAAHFF